MPRGFIAVQDESLMLRRLYFHDPYSPVSWNEVLTQVAWKPPLFALALAIVGWKLGKSAAGRRLIVANLCCWIPLIVFAVVVFEPGSPERFMPGYALLFASLAYIARTLSWRDKACQVLVFFFAAMLVVNLSFVTPAAGRAREQHAVERLEAFRKVWQPNDLLILLWYRDPIFRFSNAEPFHPLNQIPFLLQDAVEPATTRALRFRQEFATKTLSTWDKGAEVWISQRLVADRPRAEWGWVEGDSAAPWLELSGYYRQFETDAATEGDDGFLRVSKNQTNRLLLNQYIAR